MGSHSRKRREEAEKLQAVGGWVGDFGHLGSEPLDELEGAVLQLRRRQREEEEAERDENRAGEDFAAAARDRVGGGSSWGPAWLWSPEHDLEPVALGQEEEERPGAEGVGVLADALGLGPEEEEALGTANWRAVAAEFWHRMELEDGGLQRMEARR